MAPATVDSRRANEGDDMDAARQLITRRLEETDLSMKDLSLAIGHAYSFLQQFLTGASPRQMRGRDRDRLQRQASKRSRNAATC
jgi:hypothetical protein